MKNRYLIFVAVVAAVILCSSFVAAAEKVKFEPVRAPSKGPEDAPVTIIEIADYM
jgi:hypothetical protein